MHLLISAGLASLAWQGQDLPTNASDRKNVFPTSHNSQYVNRDATSLQLLVAHFNRPRDANSDSERQNSDGDQISESCLWQKAVQQPGDSI